MRENKRSADNVAVFVSITLTAGVTGSVGGVGFFSSFFSSSFTGGIRFVVGRNSAVGVIFLGLVQLEFPMTINCAMGHCVFALNSWACAFAV